MMASGPKNSDTSLANRCGETGEESSSAEARAATAFSTSSSIISFVQTGKSARRISSARSTSCDTTVIGSATTATCAGRFQPTLAASASTWMTLAPTEIASP
jgi:hypothetical protein